MDGKSRRPKEREGAISALNAAIEAMNPAKELPTITPTEDVFSSVNITLTMLRVSSCQFMLIDCRLKCTQDSMIDEVDYVELGLFCAEICAALDRGLNGRPLKDLNNSVCEATTQLTT